MSPHYDLELAETHLYAWHPVLPKFHYMGYKKKNRQCTIPTMDTSLSLNVSTASSKPLMFRAFPWPCWCISKSNRMEAPAKQWSCAVCCCCCCWCVCVCVRMRVPHCPVLYGNVSLRFCWCVCVCVCVCVHACSTLSGFIWKCFTEVLLVDVCVCVCACVFHIVRFYMEMFHWGFAGGCVCVPARAFVRMWLYAHGWVCMCVMKCTYLSYFLSAPGSYEMGHLK